VKEHFVHIIRSEASGLPLLVHRAEHGDLTEVRLLEMSGNGPAESEVLWNVLGRYARGDRMRFPVFFTCHQCGLKKVKVEVDARRVDQDIMAWMEIVRAACGVRHSSLSPFCTEVKCDLLIPAPEGAGKVGMTPPPPHLVESLMKQAPRTIQDTWDGYERLAIPAIAGELQRRESKKAFYAGALGVALLMTYAPGDDLSDDQVADYYKALIAECREFFRLPPEKRN